MRSMQHVPKPLTVAMTPAAETTNETCTYSGAPKPDGFGTAETEQIAQAQTAAVEAGKDIARRFPNMGQRQRLTVVKLFRRQLLPPRKPGRHRSKAITAAFSDWKPGLRGVALFRKHIPRFDKLGHWERKGKTGALLEAIRSRYRRERKVKRDFQARFDSSQD